MKRVVLFLSFFAMVALVAGHLFADIAETTSIPEGENQAKYWLDDGLAHEFVGAGDPAGCVLWISDEANAVFSVGKGELILRNLTLENRYPDGGIAVWGSKDSKITLENCVIHGGRDGVWSSSGQLTLANCIVIGNWQAGVGSDSNLSAINCIFVKNGNAVASQTGRMSVRYSCFYRNGNVFGNGIVDQAKIIYADPLFVNADTTGGKRYDFHLQPTSSCVDAGDPSQTDPDGSPRDIGVYGGIAGSTFRKLNVVVYVSPTTAIDSVRVSGVSYAIPALTYAAKGAAVAISADTLRTVNGWRYRYVGKVFPITFTANVDTTLTLNYDTFVRVEVTSPYSETFGSGWQRKGEMVTFGVKEDTVKVDGKIFALDHWKALEMPSFSFSYSSGYYTNLLNEFRLYNFKFKS